MTDARLRGEWVSSMKFDALSDKAWRMFTGALMWSAENGTDGFIPDRYSKRLHPDGSDIHAEKELMDAGLWSKTRDADGNKGLQLDDWDGALGQSLALQVETYKANARGRSKRYREKERAKLARVVGFIEGPDTGDATSDVTRDVREHVGKGKGKGKGDVDDEGSVDEQTGEVSSAPESAPIWEVAQIPGGRSCATCGKSLPHFWPEGVDVCSSQDAQHIAARASRVA
jgi:hypothetical protein